MGAAIVEYRDRMTGAELYQIPSRATLLYRQSQNLTNPTRSSAFAFG